MVRKLFLGAVAAVAIGFGGSAATAGEPVVVVPVGPVGGFVPPHRHHDHDYVVFVRHGWHWDRYARYETRYEAERAARRLELHGHQVRIEVVEGGRRY